MKQSLISFLLVLTYCAISINGSYQNKMRFVRDARFCNYKLLLEGSGEFLYSTYGECGSTFSYGKYTIANDTFKCSYKRMEFNNNQREVK